MRKEPVFSRFTGVPLNPLNYYWGVKDKLIVTSATGLEYLLFDVTPDPTRVFFHSDKDTVQLGLVNYIKTDAPVGDLVVIDEVKGIYTVDLYKALYDLLYYELDQNAAEQALAELEEEDLLDKFKDYCRKYNLPESSYVWVENFGFNIR